MATGGTQTFNHGVTASATMTFIALWGQLQLQPDRQRHSRRELLGRHAIRRRGDRRIIDDDAPGTTTIDIAVVATAGDLIFNDAVLLG